VELFEQIRREFEFGVGTIAGVAKKVGVHRRMVREAIGSALPKPWKKTNRPKWKLKVAVEFIDAILEGDRKAPRKQRHTAHRIWTRMQHELAECAIAERTVREYVHERKIALGFMVRETCVPQSYTWGVEAQIDRPALSNPVLLGRENRLQLSQNFSDKQLLKIPPGIRRSASVGRPITVSHWRYR